MRKIIKKLEPILKIILYIWIAFTIVFMFSANFADGEYNLRSRLYALFYLDAVPVGVLGWRFLCNKSKKEKSVMVKHDEKYGVKEVLPIEKAEPSNNLEECKESTSKQPKSHKKYFYLACAVIIVVIAITSLEREKVGKITDVIINDIVISTSKNRAGSTVVNKQAKIYLDFAKNDTGNIVYYSELYLEPASDTDPDKWGRSYAIQKDKEGKKYIEIDDYLLNGTYRYRLFGYLKKSLSATSLDELGKLEEKYQYVIENEFPVTNSYDSLQLILEINDEARRAQAEYDKENSEISSINNSNNKYYSKVIDKDKRVFAWVVAQKEIKTRLNYPDTAKFPFSSQNKDVDITSSGDMYKVSSWVKAKNAFGVESIIQFTIEFERIGSSESYTIISVIQE